MPSERRALISDIHANYEALDAVLQHIQSLGIDEIICLGDIIGYGPDPIKCLDAIMEHCDLTILGNHDQAAIFDPEGFNPIALKAIYWTRDQLELNVGGTEMNHRRWDFIGELPEKGVTLGAASLAIAAHVRNFRLCRSQSCRHDAA